MTRRLNFHWHLRQIMAAHDMWKTTDLIPLLRERGVKLSSAQVYRLVADKPERLSMRTLISLCDIFDCTPANLIEPYAETTARKKVAGDQSVVELTHDIRPERARILDDEP
ncbi:helix-turn-helix transcriptional regulator [Nonomuraea sp. NPDC050691]|uniref:helix-turn-helix domain-containing protein n=1 Tax=Nonomuraea sp. NPDC050691 TaxID=3155661 RepID=UPI0033C5CD06